MMSVDGATKTSVFDLNNGPWPNSPGMNFDNLRSQFKTILFKEVLIVGKQSLDAVFKTTFAKEMLTLDSGGGGRSRRGDIRIAYVCRCSDECDAVRRKALTHCNRNLF